MTALVSVRAWQELAAELGGDAAAARRFVREWARLLPARVGRVTQTVAGDPVEFQTAVLSLRSSAEMAGAPAVASAAVAVQRARASGDPIRVEWAVAELRSTARRTELVAGRLLDRLLRADLDSWRTDGTGGADGGGLSGQE